MTDTEINKALLNDGSIWEDESFWKLEDPDLCPFVHSLFAAESEQYTQEIDRLRASLDKALTVCRCAARVVDSSAYQGVSDEDCDLENAVRNWRASQLDV